MALLAPTSPFVALSVLQLMESLLQFPVEPGVVFGIEHVLLVSGKLYRQIAQHREFMEKLLLFILKCFPSHPRTDEWTDMEWIAYNGGPIFSSLAKSIGVSKDFEFRVANEAGLLEMEAYR